MLRRGFTRRCCVCNVTVGAGCRKGACCWGTDMIMDPQFQWGQTSFDSKFGQRYLGWSLPSFLSMTTIISNKEKWRACSLCFSQRRHLSGLLPLYTLSVGPHLCYQQEQQQQQKMKTVFLPTSEPAFTPWQLSYFFNLATHFSHCVARFSNQNIKSVCQSQLNGHFKAFLCYCVLMFLFSFCIVIHIFSVFSKV